MLTRFKLIYECHIVTLPYYSVLGLCNYFPFTIFFFKATELELKGHSKPLQIKYVCNLYRF